MDIKHILVYVDNDRDCAGRIRYAALLAARHDAHLTGVYMQRLFSIPAYASVHVPVPVLEQFDEQSEELARQAQAAFEAGARGRSVTSEWSLLSGYLPHAIAAQTRYADLLVLGQSADPELDLHEQYSVDGVLLNADVPVLMVPPNVEASAPAKHAIVCWKESREAARAVREALPLLARMDKVTVLHVGTASDGDDPHHAICGQLARHGINVEFEFHPRENAEVGYTLLSRATSGECDLLVMGGYGHSRLYETVLGGVTRYMLTNATIPILVSH